MKNLKGRCVFAQSGGPTSVINAGIAGGILAALKNPSITGVLCAHHGVKGIFNEDFFDMRKEDESEILALKNTPASAFGSVRYKLKDYEIDDTDYKRILEVFKNTISDTFSITAATTRWTPATKCRNICRKSVTRSTL